MSLPTADATSLEGRNIRAGETPKKVLQTRSGNAGRNLSTDRMDPRMCLVPNYKTEGRKEQRKSLNNPNLVSPERLEHSSLQGAIFLDLQGLALAMVCLWIQSIPALLWGQNHPGACGRSPRS
jgi:hypothetical protein